MLFQQPSYFSYDEKQVAHLLSSIGVSGDMPRRVFGLLLEERVPSISYGEFLKKYEGRYRNLSNEINLLMTQLRESLYGLYLNEFDFEGNAFPKRIILTECGSLDFFWHLYLDYWNKAFVNYKNFQVLTLPLLYAEFPFVPRDKILYKKIGLHQFSEAFFDAAAQENSRGIEIFGLEVLGRTIIIPSNLFGRLVIFLKNRLTYYVKEVRILDGLSSYVKMSVRELEALFSQDLLDFYEIIFERVLPSNYELVFSRLRLPKDSDFFILLSILHTHLKALQKIKEEKFEEKLLYEECLKKLGFDFSTQKGRIPLSDLKEIINNRMKEFKLSDHSYDLLWTYFVGNQKEMNKVVTPANLPILLDCGGGYFIHRDLFYPYFMQRYLESFVGLEKSLIYHIREHVLSGVSSQFFSSSFTFLEILAQFVYRDYPMLYHFLSQNPRILASAILYHQKKVKQLSSAEAKVELTTFFHTAGMRVKTYDEIYSFSPMALLQKAFASLPFYRRLFFLFIGRHALYREKARRLEIVQSQGNYSSVYSSKNYKRSQRVHEGKKLYMNKATKEAVPKASYTERTERDRVWDAFKDKLN